MWLLELTGRHKSSQGVMRCLQVPWLFLAFGHLAFVGTDLKIWGDFYVTLNLQFPPVFVYPKNCDHLCWPLRSVSHILKNPQWVTSMPQNLSVPKTTVSMVFNYYAALRHFDFLVRPGDSTGSAASASGTSDLFFLHWVWHLVFKLHTSSRAETQLQAVASLLYLVPASFTNLLIYLALCKVAFVICSGLCCLPDGSFKVRSAELNLQFMHSGWPHGHFRPQALSASLLILHYLCSNWYGCERAWLAVPSSAIGWIPWAVDHLTMDHSWSDW